MIVRILGEGQYRLSDDHLAHLNAIDERLEAAIVGTDHVAFSADFDALLGFVHSHGVPLEHAELASSDLLLPPADASFDEVRAMLGAGGLVPGR